MYHASVQVSSAQCSEVKEAPRATSVRRLGADIQSVLHLQRSAGNGAVAALLSSTGSKPRNSGRPVQRWVGHEHKEIGDAAGPVDIDLGGGIVLTSSQVLAIAGDEYPSLDVLRIDAETVEGKARIRAALEHAESLDARTASSLPEPSKEQKDAQKLQYINLLLTNAAHFAEGGAVDTWRQYHANALARALWAGLQMQPSTMSTAELTEAYGDHFLSDTFSGGHARTPRKAIADWYVGTFAPKVVDVFVDSLKGRLVSEFTYEVYMQLGQMVPAGTVHDRVVQEVDKQLATGLGKIPGGHDGLVRYFGLGMAGGVSGALHDLEGERGVWVASNAHPTPFQAMGDTFLDDPKNATNKAQAALAVAAAQDDLRIAYSIGEKEAAASGIIGGDLPTVIYFRFDSDIVDPVDTSLLVTAGQYMARHPESRVDLTGHADPIGESRYNYDLGMRRADSVATAMTANGARPSQIRTQSAGEAALISADPKQFNLDRRTELAWRSQAQDEPGQRDEPFDRANKELEAAVGPPYRRVEYLIPHPVEELGVASMNVPLEDWQWGSMSPALAARLDRWASEHVGGFVDNVLAVVDESKPVPIAGGLMTVTLHPRAAMQKIVSDLLAGATAFMSRAFGQPASP